jgi:NAD(P)-dependent dehydrogenase (short-subunit alcohol dehydrogenase family)
LQLFDANADVCGLFRVALASPKVGFMTAHLDHARHAVISGGASGIGRAIVEALHARGTASSVLDRAPADGLPDGTRSYRCDISDPEAVARAAALIRGESGDPGILVHCAARQEMHRFADLSIDRWRAIMRVNVDGAFHLLQAFLPAMRAAGWGRVVLVTSSTLFAPPPGMVGYVTSKGALQGLARALAAEVGADGVTVNTVAPGLTRTPHAEANVPESHFAAVLARQAVKRSGQAEDSANAVAYLVSPEASFVTGQTLLVDGGESFI